MAKIERVEIVDDIDGKPIDPDDLNRVEFEVKISGRRAARYGLDLRTANVARFEKDITKYISKAEKVHSNGNPSSGRQSAASKERTREIREWAQEHGYDVSARGRLAGEIIEAFDAAH
ncbi:Lsr2 family protein [Gordonia sp. CPCC 206044]|uniref:histone-like nucleoid-structuring protein Lsr2 n=1 Tax=Gordonia sp. CPCC 206044 TaxID=3140793 RepID=UPI003AF3F4D1